MPPMTSTMIPLGTPMPTFELSDGNGAQHSPQIGSQRGHLIIFMCNHCPFVIHVAKLLSSLGSDLPPRGIEVTAINANNTQTHPDDAPDKMVEAAAEHGWTFPYLFDETQEVATAFGAVCTPDVFLYDGDGRLYYRGQFDESRPDSGTEPTGADLMAAVDALLDGHEPPADQVPSVGCGIKWKPGNGPS